MMASELSVNILYQRTALQGLPLKYPSSIQNSKKNGTTHVLMGGKNVWFCS